MLRRCLILAAVALVPACAENREPLLPLELDGGRRWQVDDHARVVFGRMLAACAAAPAADEEQLTALGARLNEEIHELISGCTMSGPAHDQLHVLLSGYIPAVEALAAEGSPEGLESVRAHLELYREFFE